MKRIAKKLLGYFEHGEKTSIEFRNERFADKTKAISDVIKKASLPSFESKSEESTKFKPSKKNTKAKIQAIVQKQVDIFKSRFISMPEILQFDLVPSALFEWDFTAKPEKHLLITGLEKQLLSREYNCAKTSESKTSLVIDFMSLMRRISLANLQTSKESFEIRWKSILSVCEFNQLNIIYDSYITKSIKYGERQRRAFSIEPLVSVNLQETSFILEQMETFWADGSNKENLQEMSRHYFHNKSAGHNVDIILSGYLSNKNDSFKCIQITNVVTNERPDLDNHIEEADMRIIPHIAKSIESGLKNVVGALNDTDVCVLLLHYTPQFIKSGLTELWLKYGVGPKVRFIPLHILITRRDQNLLDVLLKVHILTGCDVTSKIGTKSAALKSDPHMHLKNFAENELLKSTFIDAELYLIKTLQSNSTSTIWNDSLKKSILKNT